jgi:hypothetical protein
MTVIFPPAGKVRRPPARPPARPPPAVCTDWDDRLPRGASQDRQSYPIRALVEQKERMSENWPPPGRLSNPRRNIRPTRPVGVFIAIYYGCGPRRLPTVEN